MAGRRLRRPTGLGAAGIIGVAMLAGFLLVAVAAPLLTRYGPAERVGTPYGRPDADHLLGTDDVGADLFSQLLHGTQNSLLIGFGVALLSLAIGAIVGVTSGALGGWVDAVLMRFTDATLALPFIPLIVTVAAFIGRSTTVQVVMIAALIWARPARLLRAQVLATRSRGHVRAAITMGAGTLRILIRHIGYQVAPLLIPLFVRGAMSAILLEASLSFLGLGDPQRISWGTMLFWANARSVVLTDGWLWWVLPPGLAIAALVVALGLVGVAVEERLNPSLARGGRLLARR